MASEGATDTVVANCLRQVWLACSAYRLYPGDKGQPGFVAAVQRVSDVVGGATGGGEVAIEVVGGRFHLDGLPLAHDEALVAFAHRCFRRHVEYIRLERAPGADDLAALSDVLLDPDLEDLDAASELRSRGVTSIQLSRVGLLASATRRPTGLAALTGEYVAPSEDPELDRLSTDVKELWKLALDPGTMVANQAVAGFDDPALSAQELYQTYRTVRQVVSDDLASRSDLTGVATEIIGQLPTAVMQQFLALAVSNADRDVFARDWLGSQPDTDLANRLVTWMNNGGPDAIDVAQRIIEATGRREELITLTAARLTTETLDPRANTPTLPYLRSGVDDTEVRPEVADALGQRFLDARRLDVATLSAELPSDDTARHAWNVAALRDYLRAETAYDPLTAVLERLRKALRDALAEGRAERVAEFLDVVEDAQRDRPPGPAADLLRQATDGIVTDDLMRDVVARARDARALDRLGALFGRLPEQAISGLVAALADAEDTAERAGLVTSLAEVARGRADAIIEQFEGQPWFVQRNLVAVLGRAGDRNALPTLVRASRDAQPQVRREAVRALVSLLRSDATPHIAPLVLDPDESVRKAAIGALGGLPTDAAAQALAQAVATHPQADDVDLMVRALGTHLSKGIEDTLSVFESRTVRRALPRTVRKELSEMLKARRGAR